jgi:hypothetical protein
LCPVNKQHIEKIKFELIRRTLIMRLLLFIVALFFAASLTAGIVTLIDNWNLLNHARRISLGVEMGVALIAIIACVIVDRKLNARKWSAYYKKYKY